MKNTLIIDARNQTKINIDGPSLITQSFDKMQRRFPIRLLRKIIIIGNGLEGLNAVTECAVQQVSVFFVSSHGELRAQLLGMYPSKGSWSDWFDQCLWHKNWKYDYDDVLENFWRYMVSKSKIFKSKELRNQQLVYEQLAAHLKYRWGKKRYRESKQWLKGFSEIIVAKTMCEMSIPTSHDFGRKIMDDARYLIMLRALTMCYKNPKLRPLDSPEAVGRFYQKFSDGWRKLLIFLFLTMEHKFIEVEESTGLNNLE